MEFPLECTKDGIVNFNGNCALKKMLSCSWVRPPGYCKCERRGKGLSPSLYFPRGKVPISINGTISEMRSSVWSRSRGRARGEMPHSSWSWSTGGLSWLLFNTCKAHAMLRIHKSLLTVKAEVVWESKLLCLHYVLSVPVDSKHFQIRLWPYLSPGYRAHRPNQLARNGH